MTEPSSVHPAALGAFTSVVDDAAGLAELLDPRAANDAVQLTPGRRVVEAVSTLGRPRLASALAALGEAAARELIVTQARLMATQRKTASRSYDSPASNSRASNSPASNSPASSSPASEFLASDPLVDAYDTVYLARTPMAPPPVQYDWPEPDELPAALARALVAAGVVDTRVAITWAQGLVRTYGAAAHPFYGKALGSGSATTTQHERSALIGPVPSPTPASEAAVALFSPIADDESMAPLGPIPEPVARCTVHRPATRLTVHDVAMVLQYGCSIPQFDALADRPLTDAAVTYVTDHLSRRIDSHRNCGPTIEWFELALARRIDVDGSRWNELVAAASPHARLSMLAIGDGDPRLWQVNEVLETPSTRTLFVSELGYAHDAMFFASAWRHVPGLVSEVCRGAWGTSMARRLAERLEQLPTTVRAAAWHWAPRWPGTGIELEQTAGSATR